MPVFGDYTTIGEPVAVVEERGHVSTVWQARLSGASDGRLYALKAYSPRRRSSKEGQSAEVLENDRRLEFVNGVKELKKAQSESGGSLAPVHAFGMAPEGAWYVTDFYPRSLKTWINLRVRADGAALRHLMGSVISACLALKRARGFSHGNLKTSNIFLAGKPRPLRHTPLFISDPYPASSSQLARLDATDREVAGELLNQTAEVQDLRAIGELLLQLVEGKLIANSYDYNYPVEKSAAWDQLGREGERWRERCNRLLDPQLTLEKTSLELLAKEFRPSAMPGKLAVVAGGVAVVCLVGGGIFYAVSQHGRKKAAEFQNAVRAATDALDHTNFAVAQQQIQLALERSPGDAGALKLKGQISEALESRYSAALKSAQERFDAGDFDTAIAFAKQALEYKPEDASANEVERAVEREQKFRSTTNEAWAAFNRQDYSNAGKLAEQAVGIESNNAAAIALLDRARSNEANIEFQITQNQNYTNAMNLAREAFTNENYADAQQHAEVALGIRADSREASTLKKEAVTRGGETLTRRQQRDQFFQILGAAQTAFKQGDYTSASQLVTQALGKMPGDRDALKLQADIDRQLKQIREAAVQNQGYQDAITAAKKAAQTNLDAAITLYDQALGLKPGDEAATKLREEAIRNRDALKTARDRDENYSKWMKQATTAYGNNDYSNAAWFAEQALTFKKEDSSAKSLSANAQAKLEAIKAAQEQTREYQTAIAEAQRAFDQGQYDVVVHHADAALAITNNDATAGNLKKQVVDIRSAQKSFTNGDYESAAALCARYPNIPAFINLAKTVNVPRNALNDATNRFRLGDYSFIGTLGTNEYAKTAAFAELLANAKREEKILVNLEKLTNSPANWTTVKSNLVSVGTSVSTKTYFLPIGQWVEQNDPVKRLEDHLELMQIRFGISTKPRPDLKDPTTGQSAKKFGLTVNADAFLPELDALRKEFKSHDQLTPERERAFSKIESAINTWNN